MRGHRDSIGGKLGLRVPLPPRCNALEAGIGLVDDSLKRAIGAWQVRELIVLSAWLKWGLVGGLLRRLGGIRALVVGVGRQEVVVGLSGLKHHLRRAQFLELDVSWEDIS